MSSNYQRREDKSALKMNSETDTLIDHDELPYNRDLIMSPFAKHMAHVSLAQVAA